MNKLLIITTLLLVCFSVRGQASYDTQFAFILYDENNEVVTLEKFNEEYKIADVMGRIIPKEELHHHLTYIKETGYFDLSINTIGPRFSFALYHNNMCLAIYFPFKHNNIYFAMDLKFRSGTYLFDFNTEGKEKLIIRSNIPYYRVEKLNWKKRHKALINSNYNKYDFNIYNQIKE
jgi:hypothetical protein